jgi:hypothetical protein
VTLSGSKCNVQGTQDPTSFVLVGGPDEAESYKPAQYPTSVSGDFAGQFQVPTEVVPNAPRVNGGSGTANPVPTPPGAYHIRSYPPNCDVSFEVTPAR